MATLDQQMIDGIAALPPEQVAVLDRWIDSDPEAVQILISAVPALRPMLEPFVSGNGTSTNQPQMNEQDQFGGAAALARMTMGG
ncbi:MAG: hypothetical protein Unbinned664contig1000_45 [Prokaryotic dsDNA virus sp.]|nr:MAG: hypothetical protein Unbinned664contig1000_45 [Prokaryotic dsDNA virus sp.]|tara:strand:- start:604 stop:855 length:252 start_codon:yes stop_codon:yes gene_type:complete